jgi:hypothetical protein
MVRKKLFNIIVFVVASVSVATGAPSGEFAARPVAAVVSGRITSKSGQPLDKGMVFFFDSKTGPPPSDTQYWRVPDEATEIGQDGNFRTALPAGRYYIAAIKKLSGERIGPPVEGDLFFISEDKQGTPRLHVLKSGEPTDLGVLSTAASFVRKPVKEGVTAMEGVVVGEENKPAAGILIFAFTTSTFIGRPLYVSDKTDRDGRFSLKVAAGGEYYLKARDSYGGGPPPKGGLMGDYGGATPKAVKVKTGAVTKGVEITVTPFPGRGREQQ